MNLSLSGKNALASRLADLRKNFQSQNRLAEMFFTIVPLTNDSPWILRRGFEDVVSSSTDDVRVF